MAVSPWFPASCRFYPSCSEFMIQALRKEGILLGVWNGVTRLLKCHPWGEIHG